MDRALSLLAGKEDKDGGGGSSNLLWLLWKGESIWLFVPIGMLPEKMSGITFVFAGLGSLITLTECIIIVLFVCWFCDRAGLVPVPDFDTFYAGRQMK